MTSAARPDISPQDALGAAQKLQAFREALPPEQQAVVDAAISVLVEKVSDGRSIDELLDELPDRAQLLDDVAAFRLEGDTPALVGLPTTTTTFTPYTPPKVSLVCPTLAP